MDEAEQDQYEARLKELFDSFDSTGTGSLGQEELTDLCHMLQLEEVAPTLQQALLQGNLLGRVHFDQFKEALILILSNTLSNEESFQEPDSSPEAQPKYIKDGKRYGRRSVPELHDSLEDLAVTVLEPDDEEEPLTSHIISEDCDEHWKTQDREEYEAEGQLRFWNPDDLNSSQHGSSQDWIEAKLQLICEDLGISRDGLLKKKKLFSICEQYGFQNLDKETMEDAFQNLSQDDTMSLQDFFYAVFKNGCPPTPSASTPYRQLKRHLSIQSFDESGRRTITPSGMISMIGFRLFSCLDDGSGYGSAEEILDNWHEEGIENSHAVLEALDFGMDGKINLTELTMALENELLITKNEIHRAVLASFKSEIRHLLGRTDQGTREIEKLRSDLDKNEKLKTLLASEVDDHHAAIEQQHEHNLRKVEEDYKERTAALKSELGKERDQILQHANKQRSDLEKEVEKLKRDESFSRDRLTLSLKENSRLERELLENAKKLIESENLTDKLQKNLDNLLKEKFGDLDPSSAEFLLQEERLAQIKNEYERQCRELQDRIDELQSELEYYRIQGVRVIRPSLKSSLSEEIDSKSGGVESDQGLGSEDCHPLNMSIEAELAIEQMKDEHQKELDQLKQELDDTVNHYQKRLEENKSIFESEQEEARQKFNKEICNLEEQISALKEHILDLEGEITRLGEEQRRVESSYLDERKSLQVQFEEEKAHLQDRLKQEQEEALASQRDYARACFDKEREDLVQHNAQMEQAMQEKMNTLLRTFEDDKRELEVNFHEQLARLGEQHEVAQDDLRRELLEKHQLELQEERKSMETEYNRRTSESNAQFDLDCQAASQKHEEELRNLKARHKEELQDLLEQHGEEKSQWDFEKNELSQDSVDAQDRLRERLENEKAVACTLIAQEKEVLEQQLQEHLRNVMVEKEEVQIQLEDLRSTAKKEESNLNEQILQLQSDLREELKERDELLLQAEENVQIVGQQLERLGKAYEQEKQQLNSRLLASEVLYKETCERAQQKKEMMRLEIARLQKTINELEQDMRSLSQQESDSKAKSKENAELKNTISQLQDSMLQLQQERDTLKHVEKVHEQAVKENVALLAEKARLEHRIKDLENATATFSSLDNPSNEWLQKDLTQESMQQMEDRCEEHVNSQAGHKAWEVSRLQDKIKVLEDTIKAHAILKQAYEDVHRENSNLKDQLTQLQDKLKDIQDYDSLREEQHKLSSEVSRLQLQLTKPEGSQEVDPMLKVLCEDAEKENQLLRENIRLLEVQHAKAIENNAQLYSEVSWLQAEIQSFEEITGASLKLDKMYEEVKRENTDLKIYVSQLQKRIIELEEKSSLHSETALFPKAVQTEDDELNAELQQLMQQNKHLEEYVPRLKDLEIKFEECKQVNLSRTQENAQLLEKTHELEAICERYARDRSDLQHEKLVMQKQFRKLEKNTATLLELQKKYVQTEANKEEKRKFHELHRKLEGSAAETTHSQSEYLRMEQKVPANDWDGKSCELQQKVDLLRCETEELKEENSVLKKELANSKEETSIYNQRLKELYSSQEEMWENIETVKKEKLAVQKMVEHLKKQVSELKVRNQQLESENNEVCQKNSKNLADIQDLNRQLNAGILRHKGRKGAGKEWERERSKLKEELENHKTQLSRCSDLQSEVSSAVSKNEKLQKEKEALNEELNRCVEKAAKVPFLETTIASLKHDQKSWLQESQTLKSQLAVSQEKNCKLDETLQGLNLQISRIKSDLRVTLQENEALKQDVMSLHKLLQNANDKIQILEKAVQATGLQNQQKKIYWDDLADLMTQEQQLLRQENERLQKEVHSTKLELTQCRDKVQQLETNVLSLKHHNHQSHSSMVRALEQEKLTLKRECEQLKKEYSSANRKISRMNSLERELETVKMENEGFRKKQIKLDDQLMEMLHSGSTVTLSQSQQSRERQHLQQQACTMVPREQFLQLQQQLLQAERRSQQLHEELEHRPSENNTPQGGHELLLRKMEQRMLDVEQKLRIVKLLLQEKVNQLHEQVSKNSKANGVIKDLYVENAQLLKALDVNEQRNQTSEKKNYLLEEKIAGLTKIVRELAPSSLNGMTTHHLRS
ncbi:ninein isoform X2 [Ambystoma mexicanum]|uniref:ninein isoform X2 n=1 Tax=Ambystoma mexicanum TaxID=8296 RepID=UPI0037E948DF